jgi:GNAT superfamily N-acetyltransferase
MKPGERTMNVQSLGYRTDLIFPRFDGQILDRGDYLVVLSPDNPTHYWGNFLLFARPPGPGDYETWTRLFAREIGWRSGIRHLAFGWDAPDGATGTIEPFLAAGYNLSQNSILTARSVQPPPRVNSDVAIRRLAGDEEWEQALALQVLCSQGEHELEGFTVFARGLNARHRAMVRAGLGHWFGAFLEDRLVAGLGIFADGEIGRFQEVVTHPDFRRQGICGTLVYRASQFALVHMGVQTLVMAADEHYHAARIYESVGFVPTERQAGIDWWQRS